MCTSSGGACCYHVQTSSYYLKNWFKDDNTLNASFANYFFHWSLCVENKNQVQSLLSIMLFSFRGLTVLRIRNCIHGKRSYGRSYAHVKLCTHIIDWWMEATNLSSVCDILGVDWLNLLSSVFFVSHVKRAYNMLSTICVFVQIVWSPKMSPNHSAPFKASDIEPIEDA